MNIATQTIPRGKAILCRCPDCGYTWLAARAGMAVSLTAKIVIAASAFCGWCGRKGGIEIGRDIAVERMVFVFDKPSAKDRADDIPAAATSGDGKRDRAPAGAAEQCEANGAGGLDPK